MCLYATTMLNPRYKKYPNAHPADKYVTVKCGVCYECRKARGMEWRQRLEQEMMNPQVKDMRRAFITLTVSDEVALKYGVDYQTMSLEDRLSEETYRRENTMMKDLVKKWRHAVDKKGYKQRHFFITEHGEEDTLRIHIHGILFVEGDVMEDVVERWRGGHTDIGEFRDSTIGYLCKYIHKMPRIHKRYKSIVLASPGIGRNFVKRFKESHPQIEKEHDVNPTYRCKNGTLIAMCDYYKKKIYTDKQLAERRHKLWKEGTRWVRGLEYNLKDPRELRNYYRKIEQEQKHPPLGMKPDLTKLVNLDEICTFQI
ncbi:replication initiator protein [Dipodfec virus UOA04_Rod_663]|nr:replication initiator protein [Dipodfec virus UOA04_Rod_663]